MEFPDKVTVYHKIFDVGKDHFRLDAIRARHSPLPARRIADAAG